MKTLLLAGATLALLTPVNFSPAMADGPKLSAGISQRVDTGSYKCCHDNCALRVPVRTRQARSMASGP
jgi:hypothetical protein